MENDYGHNVELVLEHQKKSNRSQQTLLLYGRCFSQLASYLQDTNQPYSRAVAWNWLEDTAVGLSKTSYSIYASALSKLDDLYSTGDILPFHYRATKKEDRLCRNHRQLMKDYCDYLETSGLASTTVVSHRFATIRLLLNLQERGVESIEDTSYSDLISILLACERMSYRSKTDYRGRIRSFLAYLHSLGLVRYGFTLLVDAMANRKGYCWNNVSSATIAEIRSSQDSDTRSLPLEGFPGIVGELVEEHREHGYSNNVINVIIHYARLLFLFMDVNNLRFDSQVGHAWIESMEKSLPYGSFSPCRRTVMLLQQSYEGITHNLAGSFRFKETLHDRLPAWCISQVDAFLAMKEAQGWKRSTLDMFRTCVCRFCIFADSIGIKGFSDITAEHIKLFNGKDRHETPEGKNAFNSRIRQFLEWLGVEGRLSNPYLYLALPNTAASRVVEVVTLTPKEQHELEDILDSDNDMLSFRDKAMIELGLHMGIRASDVVGLLADSIDWDDATVGFVQKKTGYEVDLPMPDSVANALYRYIIEERPDSEDRSIFLRCKAPFLPLNPNSAQQSLHKALPDRDVPKSGFHALRKTFATNMLRSGVTPSQVGEVLGHQGMDNVHKYLSLDERRMRLCALSLGECGLCLEGGFA